ncbi:hypothetical protein GCM10010521_75550 [Streptomyces rameus]|uniref:Uncharacterized protein n=1 Tax=Streptomyces rameus TaxID=68261 RepID=A0ABN3VAK0_9ACTN
MGPAHPPRPVSSRTGTVAFKQGRCGWHAPGSSRGHAVSAGCGFVDLAVASPLGRVGLWPSPAKERTITWARKAENDSQGGTITT